jgi:hypothetical protein
VNRSLFGLAALAGQVIVGFMRAEYAGNLYVVAATKDGKTDYWVASSSREEAVATVQRIVEPGWRVSLTERRISPKQATALKLHVEGVRARKLHWVP